MSGSVASSAARLSASSSTLPYASPPPVGRMYRTSRRPLASGTSARADDMRTGMVFVSPPVATTTCSNCGHTRPRPRGSVCSSVSEAIAPPASLVTLVRMVGRPSRSTHTRLHAARSASTSPSRISTSSGHVALPNEKRLMYSRIPFLKVSSPTSSSSCRMTMGAFR